jgi:hypothetical protein
MTRQYTSTCARTHLPLRKSRATGFANDRTQSTMRGTDQMAGRIDGAPIADQQQREQQTGQQPQADWDDVAWDEADWPDEDGEQPEPQSPRPGQTEQRNT